MTGRTRRWVGLVALTIGVALIIVDATIVNVAIPSIIRDLGIGITQAEWANSIYSLVFAALLISVGPRRHVDPGRAADGDRRRRRTKRRRGHPRLPPRPRAPAGGRGGRGGIRRERTARRAHRGRLRPRRPPGLASPARPVNVKLTVTRRLIEEFVRRPPPCDDVPERLAVVLAYETGLVRPGQ